MRRPLLIATLLAATAAGAQVTHTYDLDQQMPPHFTVSLSMAWFGIDTNDPQGGPDPSYGNWLQNFQQCNLSNDPSTCADFPDAGLQRSIASRHRPLAGIYSATAQDPRSLARIDLMLSTVRRPCDDGARIDSFSPQLSGLQYSSLHPGNTLAKTSDYAYRATVGFLDEADQAGLTNAVAIYDDPTWYWHFGSNFGLSTQQQYLDALQADIVDMVAMAQAHPSAAMVNGKPIFIFYFDSALATATEWQTVLQNARNQTGVDFYAVCTTLNASYFAAFDALAPWINLGIWGNTSGATLYDHAYAWAKAQQDTLLNQVGNYPGRVVFAALSPGFDDYTENWGACQERVIPRDPAVLQAQLDYFSDQKDAGSWDVRGVIIETWDDWTEGSILEPDVIDGTSKLVQAREGLGKIFGDPVDPAGDDRLNARWVSFGQPWNCCFAGGTCYDGGGTVTLTCPPPVDAGEDAGTVAADAGSDGGSVAPGNDGGSPSSSDAGSVNMKGKGCGCSGTAASPFVLALLLALLALRRKPHAAPPR